MEGKTGKKKSGNFGVSFAPFSVICIDVGHRYLRFRLMLKYRDDSSEGMFISSRKGLMREV